MAVNDTSPQYSAHVEAWKMMRDVSAGEAAVKAAGVAYLPKLGGQDSDRYAAYKSRASFYNATGRTIDGLSGMVFRKPPLVDHPVSMDDFINDVTLGGVPFQGFAEMSVEEVLTVGRAGVLVDFPRVEAGGMTQAEAERMNLRPFWSLYKAETILSASVGQIGNKTVLTQVRLWEEGTEAGDDEFSEHAFEQIRVLDLSPADDGAMLYRQRVFREQKDASGSKTGEWEQYGDDIVPEMQGRRLDYIPFVFFGPRDTTPHIAKPPLVDLAYVNLSHYRTVADLEHGAHFTALPTPYILGVPDNDAPEEIGPEALWHSSENASDVEVGLLEFSGQGLEALEKRREVKEQQMAALGARMLAPEKRQAEAAETAAIHRQGEISVLASLSQAVSLGLTRCMEIARDWLGASDEVSVRLNSDYLPAPMSPQALTALFQMVQGGQLSEREFFAQLQRGEIVGAEKTFEEHRAEIETEDGGAGLLRGS